MRVQQCSLHRRHFSSDQTHASPSIDRPAHCHPSEASHHLSSQRRHSHRMQLRASWHQVDCETNNRHRQDRSRSRSHLYRPRRVRIHPRVPSRRSLSPNTRECYTSSSKKWTRRTHQCHNRQASRRYRDRRRWSRSTLVMGSQVRHNHQLNRS